MTEKPKNTIKIAVLRRMLYYSLSEIDFEYDQLTDTEKRLVDREEFALLSRWVKADQATVEDAKSRISGS